MAQENTARSEEVKSYHEKYWEECSIEEKIERTRDQVKNLQSVIDRALEQIELLNEHSQRRDRGKKEVYF